MDLGRKLCPIAPHADIENNFPRKAIPYHIVLPSEGVTEETGLIFSINGYGGHPIDAYDVKLRPYLADRYNCIVVSVEYFDLHMKRHLGKNYQLSDNYVEAFNKAYNCTLPDMSGHSDWKIASALAKTLLASNVTHFDASIQLIYDADDCYQSFGFIPAIDHLQVLISLLNEYPINKKRLYILGTSYGGYIANMIGKLAPNTFQLITDNSGFSQTRIPDTVGDGYAISDLEGCKIMTLIKGFWSDDPNSPHYFDQHHAQIRSLLVADHIQPSKTAYFCAHSSEDKLAPVAEKVEFKALREGVCEVELDLVDEAMVDGQLYKNLEHGMNTSLRRFFDKAYTGYMAGEPEPDAKTDFDRESEYSFPCSNGYCYNITFSKGDVKLTLHPPE